MAFNFIFFVFLQQLILKYKLYKRFFVFIGSGIFIGIMRVGLFLFRMCIDYIVFAILFYVIGKMLGSARLNEYSILNFGLYVLPFFLISYCAFYISNHWKRLWKMLMKTGKRIFLK